ncbi:MAG: lamin tail domain-containing protein [Lentimicrobiaceae bacterium]|nr:lamin tail domain-containing protein [Lentimicrobiaceae bacterium]
MKKFTLLLTFFLFVALGLSAQTYTEKFNASNATASYGDGSFTGVNNVQWSYVHSRDEGSYAIEDKGIMLRRSDEPSSLSATFINGIGEFSFKYRKAFTAAKTRTYKVDVIHNGTTTTYDIPEFGSGNGAQTTIYTFPDPAPLSLNLAGEVTIKIYATGTTGNQQATFDTFTWTEYAGTDPTITVTSPIAGDSWEHGSNHNITWTYANIDPTATVKIDLYKDNVYSQTLATGVTINDKSWAWNNISSSIVAGNDYTIKIEEATSPATGTSGVFSIVAPPSPSITVTSPVGGENWEQGTTHAITWNYANLTSTTVDIKLYKGGAFSKNLITGQSVSTKTWDWDIPTDQTLGTDYTIIIAATECASDPSGQFSIVAPVPTITVTSPEAGNSWEHGSNHDITWTYANIYPTATVKIDLYKNNVYSQTLAPSVTINDKSWAWNNISSSITEGNDYTIKIEEATSPATGTSGVFSIVAPPPPSITFINPEGIIYWEQGSTHYISWTYSNIPDATNVSVDLYKGGSLEYNIATVPVSDKTCRWIIPADQVIDSDYQIVLTPESYSTFSSEMFSIVASTGVPKIFISEYIRGTSNNKAIEIYNGTNDVIDLALLQVKNYANGKTTPTGGTVSNLTGNLGAGKVCVIYNNGAAADMGIKEYGDFASGVMSFTGNDALEVVYNDVTCDIFGKIGEDPGTGWDVAGVANATANKTLLRKLDVTQGYTDTKVTSFGTTAANSEWVVSPQNHTANLGGFGAVLTEGADYTLAASYDIDPTSFAKYNLILNHNAVNIDKNYDKFDNIVIKSAGNTTFTIQPNINLKINGTVFSKTPNTDPASDPAVAKFNIKSAEVETDVIKTGTLLHNFAASGNIERYVTGNETLTANCYHGVSVPLVQGANPQSGIFTGSYLYRFDESLNQWEGMGASTTTGLFVNQGYLTYFPGANTTYNYTGTFNHGNFEIPYNYSNNINSQGFNFVPNPYPSHINFSVIQSSATYPYPDDLIKGFWVWDNGTYRAYNEAIGDGTTPSGSNISIGQAFFIKCKTPRATAGTLTLTNDCRISGDVAFYSPGTQQNIMRITANGNQLQDEILFSFNSQWNAGTDEGDMLKMIGSGEAPQLSSINADNQYLTINALPLEQHETVIPLCFTLGVSTEVEFVADISSLQSDITPYLIDKKVNRTINLRQNPVYTFNHENTDGDNRFELKLVNAIYSDTPFDLADENVIYVNNNKQIVVSVPSMQNTKTMVNVYDMQGKLVSSNTVFLTDTFITNAPFVPGIYVVSVVNSTQAVNKKIVVTR